MNTLDKQLDEKIRTALNECRPYLQQDGGDAEFVRYEESSRTAEIRYLGACVRCPLNTMTLRAGIERILVRRVPEIQRVEVVQ